MEKYIKTELIKKCGIYKITNTETGDYYIGSSITLYHRLKQHLYKLRTKTHSNSKLQNAYEKYGEENFTIEIIMFCDPKDVREFEYKMIDDFQPTYNLMNYLHPYCFSDETRQKMSDSGLRAARYGVDNHESKAVECYDLNGKYVTTYSSMMEALNYYKSQGSTGANQIGKCLRGERVSAFGLQWKESSDPKEIGELSLRGKINALDGRKKITVEYNNTVNTFSNAATLVQFLNTKLADIATGGKVQFSIILEVPEVPYKSCELLENPEMDNQQPSVTEM